MDTFGWISFKFGRCVPYTTKFCMTNIFPKNIFFGPGWKSKKGDFQQREKRDKNAHKIGGNIFCQQQALFLDLIHWFMHSNKV